MLGPARGAAVKLSADEEITAGLGIAEGIETTLAAIGTRWCPSGQPARRKPSR